jgi:arylsulfatase A-like enzyme/Tfp pilus assembly protein PilF
MRTIGMARKILLLIVLLLSGACRSREQHPQTSGVRHPGAPIILISIDTLRADHLPAYGYGAVATPNIDALRRDAILYSHAYSHVPLTLPSHVSILTGQLPPDNGVRDNAGFPFDASKHTTLPQLLKARGYATGAAVSAYVLRGNTGLAAAFDSYDDDIAVRSGEVLGRLQRPGGETEAVAERWIDGVGDKPFFYFLHLFEPHAPYEPPEPFKSRYAAVPYDGEIATADAIIGKFVAHLKAAGIYDRATIVLLSDHGESLNEHGEDEHGIFVYMGDIHVPLILKLPAGERAGTAIESPVQLIDVLPTLAGIAGADIPAGRGVSLLEIASSPARRIYSETLYPRIHLGWSELHSLVDDRFHFIDAPRPELYRSDDRAETTNVAGDERRAASSMRSELEPFGHGVPSIASIDPEEAKKLAALGYLSSSPGDSSGPLPDPKDGMEQLTLLKHAGQLDLNGQLAAAEREYRQIVSMNPRLTDGWTLLAQLLEREGRYDEAIETYRRGVQSAPSVAGEFALSMANVELMANRPAEAIANAQAGMKVNPGNAHLIIGRALLGQGKLDEAEREARSAMETFNYKPAGLVLLAQIYTKQHRLDDAFRAIEEALNSARTNRLDPPVLLYFVRGDLLARMNRMTEAIEAFNEEIRLYPGDRQAYANLAAIQYLSGNRMAANATMARLVKANPDARSYEIAASTFAGLGAQADAARWQGKR